MSTSCSSLSEIDPFLQNPSGGLIEIKIQEQAKPWEFDSSQDFMKVFVTLEEKPTRWQGVIRWDIGALWIVAEGLCGLRTCPRKEKYHFSGSRKWLKETRLECIVVWVLIAFSMESRIRGNPNFGKTNIYSVSLHSIFSIFFSHFMYFGCEIWCVGNIDISSSRNLLLLRIQVGVESEKVHFVLFCLSHTELVWYLLPILKIYILIVYHFVLQVVQS